MQKGPFLLTACEASAREKAIVLALCLGACLAAFHVDGRAGFNLWDEGFLWYGVQRVLQGDVPIRDFMAYNPGRYYWAAGLLRLFGADGPVELRAATALFAAVGVFAGALMVLRGSHVRMSPARILLSAFAIALFLLWMVPWWKSYDSSISLLLIASLAAVLARPTANRFFLHGIVVGIAAVFGRNHGFYALVACMLAVPPLLLGAKPRWLRCVSGWSLGVVLGFSPMLAGVLLNADLSAMFLGDLQQLLTQKGATLPIPVPWPWKNAPNFTVWFVGCFFVSLIVFALGGAIFALYRLSKQRTLPDPIFIASVATAIPYLNVAFSRADVPHLAQAMYPMLVGVLVFPWAGKREAWLYGAALAWLGLGSAVVALPQHPGYLARVQPRAWQALEIHGEELRVPKATARSIEMVERLRTCFVPPGGTVLAAPVWPGAYALLKVKAPVWDIYPLLPRDERFQRQEIERLRHAAPALVLIKDVVVDRREDRRFSNNHPLMWRHISTHYQRINMPGEPDLLIFVPRSDLSPYPDRSSDCATPAPPQN